MVPIQTIVDALKRNMSFGNPGDDLFITIRELVSLIPDAAREEIVSTLVDMPGVKVLDSETGQLLIPGEYFK